MARHTHSAHAAVAAPLLTDRMRVALMSGVRATLRREHARLDAASRTRLGAPVHLKARVAALRVDLRELGDLT